MEANTNTAPEDITQIQHQTALLTGLLMSTNKASCRNTTSLLWHLELLSNQVFSHTFRPWEFAFSPSRHRGRETERVKDGELGQLRESEIWATAPRSLLLQDVFSIRTVPMDLPYLFGHKVVIHNHTVPLSCTPNSCQASPQTSSLHPVCQQVWVHTINLEQESGRGDGEGDFVWGGRGGKVGQRTQTEAKAAAPSALRSSSRIVHNAPVASVECGGDSWWGTFERLADWL